METQFTFIGTSWHSLDEKGRLALPGKMRDELQESESPEEVVIYPDPDGGFLCLYPIEQWRKVLMAVENIEDYEERMEAKGHYAGTSEPIKVDKSGRLVISASLRAEVGLEKEVGIRGGVSKIEIWNPDKLRLKAEKEKAAAKEKRKSWNLPL